MCVPGSRITVLYGRNYHNSVHQLLAQKTLKNEKKKRNTEKRNRTQPFPLGAPRAPVRPDIREWKMSEFLMSF